MTATRTTPRRSGGGRLDERQKAEASWGREVEPILARERLLDAAGAVVARRGDLDLTVAEVAAEAGCARGTVYRYVGDRDGLRRAFVAREAARVGGLVARRIAGSSDPRELLVAAVVAAVEEVRAEPLLAAWFVEGAAGATGRLALQVAALRTLVSDFVADLIVRGRAEGVLRADVDPVLAVEAVVRLTLSLLSVPVEDGGEATIGALSFERRLVEAMLVPVLFRN